MGAQGWDTKESAEMMGTRFLQKVASGSVCGLGLGVNWKSAPINQLG